jgi:hypothetical protein
MIAALNSNNQIYGATIIGEKPARDPNALGLLGV